MALKLKNNAVTTLSLAMSATDLQIKVSDPSVFPTLDADDYFYATIVNKDDDTIYEIVKVTDITSDTLTMDRGVEGTTALSWNADDIIEQRATAQTLYDLSPYVPVQREYIDELVLVIGAGSILNTSTSIAQYNKRLAPKLIEMWDSYYGAVVRNTIVEVSTGTVMADDIQFATLDDIATWVSNNVSSNSSGVVMKVYERVDPEVPTMTRMFGQNRFFSAMRGKRRYTSTVKYASNSRLPTTLFRDMVNRAHSISAPDDVLTKKVTWISNSKKNVYTTLHANVTINMAYTNGGGDRAYYDTTSSSYGVLSNGEEDFKRSAGAPFVASMGQNSGSVAFYSLTDNNQILNDYTSDVLVYPVQGVVNSNRKAIVVKPIGMDTFVMETPNWSLYTLEAVAYNDVTQSAVNIKSFSSMSDFVYSSDDPATGKMRIDKVNFLGLMASVTQSHDNANYSDYVSFNTIRFRLRDKATGKVGKLSRFGIVYDNAHRINTFRFMVKNFD